MKEPKASNFSLHVDLYEYAGFKLAPPGSGKDVYIVIRQGAACSGPIEAKRPKRGKDKTQHKFTFDEELGPDPLHTQFPRDYAQIPDVFIDVYVELERYNTKEELKVEELTTRVGYLRIPAMRVASKKPEVQWWDISSPYNDINSNSLG